MIDFVRRRYYNPVLDPHCQAKMTDKMRAAVDAQTYDDGGPLNEPDADHPANLVSSLCDDGLHRPALDIDVPMVVVESATPNHWHVYFPTIALSWERYCALLFALETAGILESDYVRHSIGRGQTLLRMPGVPRVFERPT